MPRSTDNIEIKGSNFTVGCYSCLKNGITNIRTSDSNTVFTSAGSPVLSANCVQRIVGIWDSDIFDAGTDILYWKAAQFTSTDTTSGNTMIMFRSGSSKSSPGNWSGPFTMDTADLSAHNGRYAQLRIMMICEGETPPSSPSIQSASVTAYVSDSSASFFTKIARLNFKAEHVMLSYNGTIDDAMILQFAVSGKETADFSAYQTIEPNRLTRLDSISPLADSLKVGIRGTGSSTNTFVLDEFAIILSSKEGDQLIIPTPP